MNFSAPFSRALLKFGPQPVAPKPHGLWYSCGNEWVEWARTEMPHKIGAYNYRLTLRTPSVLILNTEAKVLAFEKQYGRRGGDAIDWAAVSRTYAGVEICPYQWNLRMSSHFWYYGWDVASGCIWRKGAVAKVELIGAKR